MLSKSRKIYLLPKVIIMPFFCALFTGGETPPLRCFARSCMRDVEDAVPYKTILYSVPPGKLQLSDKL